VVSAILTIGRSGWARHGPTHSRRASALPGYGTANLPWTPAPISAGPYLTKTEPHRDSCDDIAGTQGWSQVSVEGGFDWNGSTSSLFSYVGGRLTALGWSAVTLKQPTSSEAIWSKRLANGSTAETMLDLGPLGAPHWEFDALAPPVGKAVTGC
jgi:hypothetical protein